MEIQHLRAFVLVAETGSFSLAAEKLHLTQPAVSKRVALLEQQLNSELFDRIGRQIRLTEAGQALLPHARQIEQQLLLAEQSVRDLAGEIAGTLRLATSHHIGLHRLPPVLSRFSTDCPAVNIDIEFMDSERAYELITQGKIELAVVTLSPEDSVQFTRRNVWRDQLEFMVAPDHELAQCSRVDMATLATAAAVLPGLNTYTGQIVKRLFDQHGLELNVSMMTNYLETIRMMASVGLGWTMLPASMRDDSLVALDVEGIAVERLLGFVYHRGRSLSRAAAAFIACLEAYGDEQVP